MFTKRTALVPLLAGLAVLTAVPTLAQTQKPRTPQPRIDSTPVVPSQAGVVPLEVETWASVFADEPAVAFENCSEQLEKGDLEKAGHYLLKAAEHTRIAAYGSDDELKGDLLGMERRLREFGETLKKGTAVPAPDLAPVFARDLYLLAEHHLVRAERHWLKGKTEKTGGDLGAAVFDLEHSLLYDPRPLKGPERELLTDGKTTAAALKTGDKTVTHDQDRVARIVSDLLDLAVRRSEDAGFRSG